jgi:transcription antitermination factor NusG
MPILPPETAWFPPSLFDSDLPALDSERRWRVLHTKPRQEKSLARYLLDRAISFYLPLVSHRVLQRRRLLTSYVPLFPGYLFLRADPSERVQALMSGRVVRTLEVEDQAELWEDLLGLWRLLASGMPVTPEQRLAPGAAVEITSGPLAGLRGKIIRAASGRRFVVEVHFIQSGASVLLDDFVLKADFAAEEAQATRS